MELGWAPAYAGLAAVLHGTAKEAEGQVWGQDREAGPSSRDRALLPACLPAGPGWFQRTGHRGWYHTAAAVAVHVALLSLQLPRAFLAPTAAWTPCPSLSLPSRKGAALESAASECSPSPGLRGGEGQLS